jgi:hypothetical protein
VRPSAFAVSGLMVSSTFVDCWTGRSAGFSPLSGERSASAREECFAADHEPAGSQLDQGCEDRIEVAIGARMQDMELELEGAGRRLQVSRLGLGNNGIGGLVGLTSRAMTVPLGTNSCSTSSCFGPISTLNAVTPVRLPPGRFRLATSIEFLGAGRGSRTPTLLPQHQILSLARLPVPPSRRESHNTRNSAVLR